jgi:hypothetical protein
MFSDEVLEKIFAHPNIHRIPIAYQATMIDIIEDVLEKVEEENATVPES